MSAIGPGGESRVFDVVIMGGGPAGSTLAAILARKSPHLRIGLLEKDFFPREHIGESFSHRVTAVLEESGALAKVLASDCYVKKYGGYYAWDAVPAATLFDPRSFERDGVERWSIHVNRSEFDAILLDHARSCGVEVHEGVGVTRVTREGGLSRVELGDDDPVYAKIFVEASGRQTAVATGAPKAYLSQYKNIAIWNHVLFGKSAQSLPGDWNIFRARDLSSIANFAFEDGWFWYIPVPKLVLGERKITHSLGMVTDPQVLKEPDKRYTDPQRFMKKAREVPLLADLIADAQPIADKVLTATNYSMISERFCDFDEGWMLIGDAAYFVDPLFSSGVAFAMMHADAAAAVIRWTLEGSVGSDLVREVWDDYDRGWQTIARSFALSIDQWYHAIAVNNPTSVYWQVRAKASLFDPAHRPFQELVDTGIAPDLLRVLSRGTDKIADLGTEGPLVEALLAIAKGAPKADARIAMHPEVAIRESLTVDPVRGKGAQSFDPRVPIDAAAARYWVDPVRHGGDVPPMYGDPRRCQRFFFKATPGAREVRFEDAVHGGRALFEQLSAGPTALAELEPRLHDGQRKLLRQLIQAGMVITV